MRVLVACEFSGAVRDAFTARGHYARSVDLLPTEAHAPVVFAGDLPLCGCCGEEPWCPVHEMHYGDCVCVGPTEDEAEYSDDGLAGGRHLSGDLFSMDFAHEWFDLVIAHPPCTHLAVSGARWFKEKGSLVDDALDFVRRIMALPVPRLCIENPVSIISSRIRKPDQIIQPWMFGHGETKATCLWLTGLPKLTPTNIVAGREARIHKLPPSADRWKLRSATYQGIADAMADQWGRLDAWSPGADAQQPLLSGLATV
jgi:hypothetical protein